MDGPQAGLMGDQAAGDQRGLTMDDKSAFAQSLYKQGYNVLEVDAVMRATGLSSATSQTPEPAESTSVGLGGELGFGARQLAEDLVSGTGRMLSDVGGVEGADDVLTGIGEYLGPSAEQEAAQQRQAEERQRLVADGEISKAKAFAHDAGDAILQSTPQMGASIAGGAAAGALLGSVVPGVGTVIGGMVGALAMSVPALYKPSHQLRRRERHGYQRPRGQEEGPADHAHASGALRLWSPSASYPSWAAVT